MTLSLKQYRDGTGAKDLVHWINTSLQQERYKAAQVQLCQATLKVNDIDLYEENLKKRLEAAKVLRPFFTSKKFRKKQLNQKIRKQKFERKVVNDLVTLAKDGRGTRPLHFAYGDARFASTMRGCEGGTPHARLARMLVLDGHNVHRVWEYYTTKR